MWGISKPFVSPHHNIHYIITTGALTSPSVLHHVMFFSRMMIQPLTLWPTLTLCQHLYFKGSILVFLTMPRLLKTVVVSLLMNHSARWTMSRVSLILLANGYVWRLPYPHPSLPTVLVTSTIIPRPCLTLLCFSTMEISSARQSQSSPAWTYHSRDVTLVKNLEWGCSLGR